MMLTYHSKLHSNLTNEPADMSEVTIVKYASHVGNHLHRPL
jgi:hypothetical protein